MVIFAGESSAWIKMIYDAGAYKDFSDFKIMGVMALPAWDSIIQELLNKYKDEKIFLSVSEFNGIKRIDDIGRLRTNDYIDFSSDERLMLFDNHYTTITNETRIYIRECFLKRIKTLVKNYNLILVPLPYFILKSKLSDIFYLPNTYDDLIKLYPNNCVDLGGIENYINTDANRLTGDGYRLLRKKMDIFL